VRSGDDEPTITDWSVFDGEFVENVLDRVFVHKTFYTMASLQARQSENGWVASKPHRGQDFDDAQWTLIPGGWDHEHCRLCYARIVDGMTYWANGNEVIILCDRCFDHYRPELQVLT
jgi:hypothetical protein